MYLIRQAINLLIIFITLIFSSDNEIGLLICLFFTYVYIKQIGYALGEPLILIFIALLLFNFRPFLDVIFDDDTFGNTHGFFKVGGFDIRVLDDAQLYIKLSLFAYLVGLSGCKINKIDTKNFKTTINYNLYKYVILIPTVCFCLLLIAVCIKSGGYVYFNSGAPEVRFLRQFIPFLTISLAINLIFFNKGFITFVIISLGFMIAVFIGARMLGLTPLLCYMTYLSINKRALYARLFPVIGFFIICLTVFVNFFRSDFVMEDTIDISFILKFFLEEVSFTSNLVPMAIEYTAKYDYAYGINYLGAIASIIPKLAFWMRVGEDSYSFSSSLGMFYDASAIKEGLGLNGSLFGESYFSFGFMGIVIIFLFSKFLKCFFSRTINKPEIYFLILTSSPYLITSFIFESVIVVRGIVYYSIFPILIYILLISISSQRLKN
jgi:hypothetical protein